jgi:hypothetical protein
VPALVARLRRPGSDAIRREIVEALGHVGPPAQQALAPLAELSLLGRGLSPAAERAWWAIRHNLVTPLGWMSLDAPGQGARP